ncbi:putative 3-beta-hydroxysteroid-Delta(8) [Forsythia ovata]|uniref:3-beta-hydroxysteroid-Delta(8) n=1 Tax=Forsythia ovata TaxID=205694 RepID=A0ABD1T678_9LAMI
MQKTADHRKMDHPYIPRDLKLPGYVPVFLSQLTILSVYGISSLLGKNTTKVIQGMREGILVSVTVEGITSVLEGPACLLAVFAIATKKLYRYTLQLAISLGQLYGTFGYFITSYLEGYNFAASMYYYYAYYITANGFWIVIPTIIIIYCWKKISTALQVQEQKKTKLR